MHENKTSHTRIRGIRNRLGRFTKLALSLTLITGFLSGAIVLTLGVTAADAAQAVTCIDPASGGTSTTFHEGVPSNYLVECEEETGISGTSAYPTIAINTNTVPADGNPALATGGSCTTGTSGSGATEQYIEECKFSDTPTSSDAGSYAATFTATPGSFSGSTLTPINSGTLTVTINAPTVTCIDPASGGTADNVPRRCGQLLVPRRVRGAEWDLGRHRLPELHRHRQRLPPGRRQPDLRHLDVELPCVHHRHLGVRRNGGVHPRVRPDGFPHHERRRLVPADLHRQR